MDGGTNFKAQKFWRESNGEGVWGSHMGGGIGTASYSCVGGKEQGLSFLFFFLSLSLSKPFSTGKVAVV